MMTAARLAGAVAIVLATGACVPGAPAARAVDANVAVFAGGCYWTMEKLFAQLPGVIDVRAGAAGMAPGITIEAFKSGRTDYVEAVEVKFDGSRISYRQLVDAYWRMIDPTDDGGQACDRGPQYRTRVFATPLQMRAALASRRAAAAQLGDMAIVTPIISSAHFAAAPADQQDFAETHSQRYQQYDKGCGRARRLAEVWGRTPG